MERDVNSLLQNRGPCPLRHEPRGTQSRPIRAQLLPPQDQSHETVATRTPIIRTHRPQPLRPLLSSSSPTSENPSPTEARGPRPRGRARCPASGRSARTGSPWSCARSCPTPPPRRTRRPSTPPAAPAPTSTSSRSVRTPRTPNFSNRCLGVDRNRLMRVVDLAAWWWLVRPE